jgi:CheY-like chemotaxis protein
VLHNLLSNAVKFTETGEVRMGVRPLGGRRYRLEVKDTGVGFDPKDRARLFDRFAQGDGSATRKFSGAGLGLALVTQCARLMGADFDCASVPGQGAAFGFELELPPAGEAAGPAKAPEPAAPGAGELAARSAPLKVLVVDDNATNRRVLELILSQLGAEALPAENGQEALDAFEADRFDLILMDIQMPVMDGLTATRAIRARERRLGLAATPVIIISANCMPEHVQAGLEAGAQQCLGKPINAMALIDAISHVLEPSRRAAAA